MISCIKLNPCMKTIFKCLIASHINYLFLANRSHTQVITVYFFVTRIFHCDRAHKITWTPFLSSAILRWFKQPSVVSHMICGIPWCRFIFNLCFRTCWITLSFRLSSFRCKLFLLNMVAPGVFAPSSNAALFLRGIIQCANSHNFIIQKIRRIEKK